MIQFDNVMTHLFPVSLGTNHFVPPLFVWVFQKMELSFFKHPQVVWPLMSRTMNSNGKRCHEHIELKVVPMVMKKQIESLVYGWSIKDPTHIPLEDTPDVSPTVYEGIPFFVGVWGSLCYLPRACGQNH